MTKNGRLRRRNSQLSQVWMLGLANRTEAQLWLEASFVPDGTKKTELRPIALLETPLKVMESGAFDQDVDHIIALMQEQQVGFRVGKEAEAMINTVRMFMKNGTNRVLMHVDISNASGSTNRMSVLKEVTKHIPCLAPLCAPQFVRDGTVAVIQERGENERKCEPHCSVVKGVWQGSTLSSATFCLTFWSKMSEAVAQANREGLVMGIIAYADDFTVSSEGGEADRVWDETTGALGETGLEIHQSKSCFSTKATTGWNQNFGLQEGDCCSGHGGNRVELDGSRRTRRITGSEATE